MGDFITDMTPCAPSKGGWGFSAPMGTASLVGVSERWQDAVAHFGGVFSYGYDPEKLYFEGGFGSGQNEMPKDWTFTVNRLTGTGELKRAGTTTRFSCRAKEQLF